MKRYIIAVLIPLFLAITVSARHAGKSSMAESALRKCEAAETNSVNISDTTIYEALGYYRNHGSPSLRLKAFYYRGMIVWNRKDAGTALENFILAEHYIRKRNNPLIAGKLYLAKSDVYLYLRETDNAIKDGLQAIEYFRKSDDMSGMPDACLSLSTACLMSEKPDSAQMFLSQCKSYWQNMSDRQRSQYFANDIYVHAMQKADRDVVFQLIDNYISTIDASLIKWLYIASLYDIYGCGSLTLRALKRYENSPEFDSESADYHYLMARALEKTGKYREALMSYDRYNDCLGRQLSDIFDSGAGFMEERYNLQQNDRRQDNTIMILILWSLIGVLTVLLLFREINRRSVLRKIENDGLQRKLKAADAEIGHLRSLQRLHGLDEIARKNVEERLGILNRFVLETISTGVEKKAHTELLALMHDREYFMESTRMSFFATNPEFIGFLKESGLSENEIGYCCLLCIGFSVSEINSYLDRKIHYNYSYTIRKKLGLNGSTPKLATFLTERLAEMR